MIQLITSLGLSQEELQIEGFEQHVYTVRADLQQGANITQELAHDSVYGYEYLSSMAVQGEEKYPLGVNGMFYDGYGRPQGVLIKDYELISLRSIDGPVVLIYEDGRIEFQDIDVRGYLVYQDVRQPLYEINDDYENQGVGVYTKWFGKYLYLQDNIRVYRIEDQIVKEVVLDQERVSLENNQIKENRYFVSRKIFSEQPIYNIGEGIRVEIESSIPLEGVRDAFQTGGWLVYEGENVAKDFEPFVGHTLSLQPRTAIGITENNQLIIKVVDGRQAGKSQGVTGKQLAQLMKEAGAQYAAYLDGGSSSLIVQQGKVLSSPSMGEEKRVAHGLFFDRNIPKELQN